jgi:hypothetical protein
MRVCATKPGGEASFDQLRAEVPNYLNLSADDLSESQTRPGEALWEQQLRNIQSHHKSPGNAINLEWLVHIQDYGYRITDIGREQI